MALTVAITGASSGIGLELCRLYDGREGKVYALCRKASRELRELSCQVIEGVDITSPAAMEALFSAMQGVKLDVLINNAGFLTDQQFGSLDYQAIEEQFAINTLGPLRVTEALNANLHEGSRIAMITSRMGSIEDNTSGGRYGYRMSKAALNAASKSLAHDLKGRGIAVAIIHPGFVKTRMVGFNGDITPAVSAQRIIERINALTLENTGTFWHSNGEILPW